MVNLTYSNVVNSVNSGIETAVKEFLKLSKNYVELSYAPEYYINVNIAKYLKTIRTASIFLEEPMGDSWEPTENKAPEDWKSNRRYDIVVRDREGYPYAVIEVKNRVYEVSNRVIIDFQRLSTAFNAIKGPERVFKMGIFAFYTVFDEKNVAENKENIEKLYSDLEAEFKKYKGEAEVKRETIGPKLHSYNKDAVWGGGCFVLSPP